MIAFLSFLYQTQALYNWRMLLYSMLSQQAAGQEGMRLPQIEHVVRVSFHILSTHTRIPKSYTTFQIKFLDAYGEIVVRTPSNHRRLQPASIPHQLILTAFQHTCCTYHIYQQRHIHSICILLMIDGKERVTYFRAGDIAIGMLPRSMYEHYVTYEC